MTVHLKKLAPGCQSLTELRARQKKFLKVARGPEGQKVLNYGTGFMPKRADEIVDGGSLYWVVKGFIVARNRIVFLGPETDDSGRRFCRIQIDPALIPTEPMPHRPFQGWRYLKPEAAPPDLVGAGRGGRSDELPPELMAELRGLGLI